MSASELNLAYASPLYEETLSVDQFVKVLSNCQAKLDRASELSCVIDEKIRIYGDSRRTLYQQEKLAYSLAGRILLIQKNSAPFESKLLEQLKKIDHAVLVDPSSNVHSLPGNSLNDIARLNPTLTIDQCWRLKQIIDNPKSLEPYFNLLGYIKEGDITFLAHFPDGRVLDKKMLLQEAMRWHPEDAHIYNSLAESLNEDEYIQLPNGNKANKKELFREAIKFNPKFAAAYYGLGMALSEGDNVLFDNEVRMDRQKLLLETLKWNSNFANAYYQLALTLPTNKTKIKRPDGSKLSKQKLFLETLRCDVKHSDAYFHLALTLAPDQSIELPDGRKMNQISLFMQTIILNPKNYYMNSRSHFIRILQQHLPQKEKLAHQIHANLLKALEEYVNQEDQALTEKVKEGQLKYDSYMQALHLLIQQLVDLSFSGEDHFLTTEEKR